jgi:hypothetical protein
MVSRKLDLDSFESALISKFISLLYKLPLLQQLIHFLSRTKHFRIIQFVTLLITFVLL